MSRDTYKGIPYIFKESVFIHKDRSISGREVLITWGRGLKNANFCLQKECPLTKVD